MRDTRGRNNHFLKLNERSDMYAFPTTKYVCRDNTISFFLFACVSRKQFDDYEIIVIAVDLAIVANGGQVQAA